MTQQIKKVDTNPMSINILKLQRYNFNYFTLEEVVFFEYLVVKGNSFRKKIIFWHSSNTIIKETGIKKSKLNTIILKFVDLGIIEVEIKGFPKVKHFRVYYDIILGLLEKIYQLPENEQERADFRKLLNDFYQPFAERGSQKNINKNIKEETIKSITKATASDKAEELSEIDNFYMQFHYMYNLPEESNHYEESKCLMLYRNIPCL